MAHLLGVDFTATPRGTLLVAGRLGEALARDALYPLAGCPVCARTVSTVCGVCGASFASCGVAGIQSLVPTHYHLEAIGSGTGVAEVMGALCPSCYANERRSVYPSEAPALA